MREWDAQRDFRDDGGSPMWRVRRLNWYERASPQQVFAVAFVSLIGLLIVAPIVALLLCWAFIP